MTTQEKATERPILMSAPMVKAILAGRKTQTRRVIKPQPDNDGLWNDDALPRSINSDLTGWNGIVYETGESREFKCPYGQVGDILWVRETWCHSLDDGVDFYYKASNPDVVSEDGDGSPWKPSIHMPKQAARLWLKITGIRVERVHDISEQDAIAEGIYFDKDSGYWFDGESRRYESVEI